MPACISCRLYLLRDALETFISRETEGRARCLNFPFLIYLKMQKKKREKKGQNTIGASCINNTKYL